MTPGGPLPVALPVPTKGATQIYDDLMSGIDPELVSSQISQLVEKYAGESDADRRTRVDRYEKAFAAFDRSYAEKRRAEDLAIGKIKREAMKSAEAESQREDAAGLSTIESSFA